MDAAVIGEVGPPSQLPGGRIGLWRKMVRSAVSATNSTSSCLAISRPTPQYGIASGSADFHQHDLGLQSPYGIMIILIAALVAVGLQAGGNRARPTQSRRPAGRRDEFARVVPGQLSGRDAVDTHRPRPAARPLSQIAG